jgi:chloramphenicol 3-O-phosphotransferase
MFPKKGRKFPVSDDRPISKAQYAAIISAALHSELDNSHRSIKTVMRWTGANERTVKNWFSGINGPRGEHLICLARNCEAVFTAFNQIAKGGSTLPSSDLGHVRGLLCDAIEVLDGWALHENPAGKPDRESTNDRRV